MSTSRNACAILSLVGALFLSLPLPSEAQDQDTVVRRAEATLCDDLRTPDGIAAPECVCNPGAFCLSRVQIETATAASEDDVACRSALEAWRNRPPVIVETGWTDGQIAAIVIGVAVGALALGFGAGMLVGEYQ